MPLTRRTLLQALAALWAARPLAAAPAAPAAAPFMDLAIAGTPFHRYHAVAATLRAGDRLLLRREPANPRDPNAIEIVTEAGEKLGYVPRRAARDLAPRLDAGERIEAAISGFLPVPEPGERAVIPAGLVWTICAPGEPVVTLSA